VLFRSGLTPEEYTHSSIGGMSGYAPFAGTTDADGKFIDTPVGTCFDPHTQNYCGAVVQEFRVRVPLSGGGDQIYSLGTQNNRIDAVLGKIGYHNRNAK